MDSKNVTVEATGQEKTVVSRKNIRVWISKYALTKGVFEETVDQDEDHPTLVSVVGVRYSTYYHGNGKDWHMTKELAVKRAEKMRAAKISSLTKQIAKIKAIEF